MSSTNVVSLTVTKKASRSINGPFVCISVPKNYDVVLRLQSETNWQQLRTALSNCLQKHGILLKENEAENDILLEAAETKDKRQRKLDHFFREAYSKAFNAPHMSDSTPQFEDTPSDEVLQMTLSKSEFADAMGMRENDLFVERMFSCMSKEKKNAVCFQEFLEILRRFTQGGQKEKFQLVFDMCDRDRNGQVSKEEFCEFMKSLNTAVGVKLDQYEQEGIIESVLLRAGIDQTRTYLDYSDFEAIFSELDDSRRPIGVHFRKAQLKINLEETESLNSFAVGHEENSCLESSWTSLVSSYLETYRQHIAILFMFFAINLILFLERFWCKFYLKYLLYNMEIIRIFKIY